MLSVQRGRHGGAPTAVVESTDHRGAPTAKEAATVRWLQDGVVVQPATTRQVPGVALAIVARHVETSRTKATATPACTGTAGDGLPAVALQESLF